MSPIVCTLSTRVGFRVTSFVPLQFPRVLAPSSVASAPSARFGGGGTFASALRRNTSAVHRGVSGVALTQAKVAQTNHRRLRRVSTQAAAATMPILQILQGPAYLAILKMWAVTVVPCCLGFVDPVAVFSTGYGLSCAAAGAVLLASASKTSLGLAAFAHCAGLVAYGMRLAIFLFWRQNFGYPEWRKRAANSPEARAKNVAIPVALCSLFYALLCSPALWASRAAVSGAMPTAASLAAIPTYAKVALGVQWFGLILEAIGDFNKAASKAANKDKPCMSGVYKFVRHPNYAGEILFWIGTFVAGVESMLVVGAWTVAPAALGLFGILSLMFRVTNRLDEKQSEKYSSDVDDYVAYVKRTKKLIPFVY